MDVLSGALRELARDAEPAETVDPAGLWRRGRQRVRRQRLAIGGVAVALAVLVGATAWLTPTDGVVMPAGGVHEPGLPRSIYQPPSWLGDTTGTGAFARLAVLGAAPRHGRPALFGISATTGEYRFLDLPDLATVRGAALSPDGSRVAYWSADGISGTAFATEAGEKPVGGLAILDLTDGHVVEYGAFTEHGLGPGAVTWLDDDTVLFRYGQKQTDTAVTQMRSFTWTPPDASTAREVSDRTLQYAPLNQVRNGDGTLLVPGDGWIGYDRSLRPTGTRVRVPTSLGPVSLSGSRVAAIGQVGSTSANGLYTGIARTDGGTVALERVAEITVDEFLGWTAADTVLVSGWSGGQTATPSLYEADLVHGTVRRLGGAGADSETVVGIARTLLERPFVEGERPRRVDPRLLAAGAGLLAGGAALVLRWRRRARE